MMSAAVRTAMRAATPFTARVAGTSQAPTWIAVRCAHSGVVKWFNITKGYGFLVPDDPGADVFVHQSSIQTTGFRFLREGERVSYDVVETDRGVQAANVSGPDGEPLNRTRDVFAPETDVFGDAGDGSDFDDTFSDADQAQK